SRSRLRGPRSSDARSCDWLPGVTQEFGEESADGATFVVSTPDPTDSVRVSAERAIGAPGEGARPGPRPGCRYRRGAEVAWSHGEAAHVGSSAHRRGGVDGEPGHRRRARARA